MKTLSLSFVLLLSASSIANAGFFDSFFGNDEPAKEPVTETAQAAPETETASAMGTATDIAMSLIPQLTQQLGVSDTQAEGGMGALFEAAQSQLSSDEFSLLGQGVPDMSSLLAAAPSLAPKSGTSNITGALSNLGGIASSIGGLGKLTQQFEALGLSTEMIGQFATIAIDYFSSSSSEEGTGALLQKGLSSFL
jgi:hypothetical protein